MLYSQIIDHYASFIETLLIRTPFTIPVYTDSEIDLYISDYGRYPFDGILVWSLQATTTTNEILLQNYEDFITVSYSDLVNRLPGVFIVPIFGSVKNRYFGTFTVIMNFDFNLQRDPYGYWQKNVLNDYWSKHEYYLKQMNYQLIPGYTVYVEFSEISQPIRQSYSSSFLRRSCIVNIRYCKLFD